MLPYTPIDQILTKMSNNDSSSKVSGNDSSTQVPPKVDLSTKVQTGGPEDRNEYGDARVSTKNHAAYRRLTDEEIINIGRFGCGLKPL